MEREIKFRCWDKFQKKYIFTGFHICGEVTAFCGMDMVIHQTWKERSEKLGYKTTLEAWNDFEFEEFTGVQDIKGVDIYEFDVVESNIFTHSNSMQSTKIRSVVTFKEGCFILIPKHYDLKYSEVVGNIHDEVVNEIK